MNEERQGDHERWVKVAFHLPLQSNPLNDRPPYLRYDIQPIADRVRTRIAELATGDTEEMYLEKPATGRYGKELTPDILIRCFVTYKQDPGDEMLAEIKRLLRVYFVDTNEQIIRECYKDLEPLKFLTKIKQDSVYVEVQRDLEVYFVVTTEKEATDAARRTTQASD